MIILKEMRSKTRKRRKIADSFHHDAISNLSQKFLLEIIYGRNSPIPAHLSSRRCCTGDAWANVYSRLSMPSTITSVAPRAPNRHS